MSKLKKIICVVASFGLCLPLTNAHADLLGSIESLTGWDDVAIQTSVGTQSKTDGPNSVLGLSGEMVAAPVNGSAVPHKGNMLIDLRPENQSAPRGDEAHYNYHINADDFGDLDSPTLSSGTVDRECWICPETWGNDLSGFVGAVIFQTNSVVNSNEDMVASIGIDTLRDKNSPEVDYLSDGINWFNTGLETDSDDWSIVSFELDLVAMTSEVFYENIDLDSISTLIVKRASEITDTTEETSEEDPNVNTNSDDDVSLAVTAQAVPNPSSFVLGFAGIVALGSFRRRSSSI